MPQATKGVSDDGRPTYSVHEKFFCFHRSRRPDAVDPETGERLGDVLVFRVADSARRRRCSPTTAACSSRRRTGTAIPRCWCGSGPRRIDRDELRDIVAEAWLTRAQKRVAKAWLAEQGIAEE